MPHTEQNQSPSTHGSSNGLFIKQPPHRIFDREFSDSQPGHCHIVSSSMGGEGDLDRDRDRDLDRDEQLAAFPGTPEHTAAFGDRDRDEELAAFPGPPELCLQGGGGRAGFSTKPFGFNTTSAAFGFGISSASFGLFGTDFNTTSASFGIYILH